MQLFGEEHSAELG